MPSVSTLNPDAPTLLVQLSDSHLFAEADAVLLGMNTRDSLQRVIDLVREQQPRIDLLLATGDLSQDGTLASYQQFREMTAPFGVPARWIPGNHDEPQVMAHAAVHSDLLEPVVDIGHWRITLLDFDVAKHHWFINDIAIACQNILIFLSGGMNGPVHNSTKLSEFLQAFMDGYSRENQLAPEWLDRLDLFITYRRILLFTVMNDWIRSQPKLHASWKGMILSEPGVAGAFSKS